MMNVRRSLALQCVVSVMGLGLGLGPAPALAQEAPVDVAGVRISALGVRYFCAYDSRSARPQTCSVSDAVAAQSPAPYEPAWRIVPPTTDPERSLETVRGLRVQHGTLLHGEGNLLLVQWAGEESPGVVQLPTSAMDAAALPVGAAVVAEGTPVYSGILAATSVEVSPAWVR